MIPACEECEHLAAQLQQILSMLEIATPVWQKTVTARRDEVLEAILRHNLTHAEVIRDQS
jgi:hypothetical protein